MVSIGPDRPTAPKNAVHGLCCADRESLEPPRQRPPVVRLHQHVHVIALHGERDDAEGVARSLADGDTDRREHQRHPQTRQPRTQRDVHRRVARVRSPHAVGDVAPCAASLAAGAVPPTAVLANDELELSRALAILIEHIL
jgi:hypothetical protein